MITRLLGALALACALASSAMAQNITAPAGAFVPTQGIAFGAKDSAATFVDPTHALPVAAGGYTIITSGSFTTPAGTTAYSVGDLIANSATAGSVTPTQLSVCRSAGSTGMVRRVRLKTPDTGFASATVRVHLYRDTPTIANGDNGAWSTTESNYLGAFDVTLDRAFTDAAKGLGAPVTGSEVNFDCAASSQVIYALLEARTAATPQGGKLWTLVAEVLGELAMRALALAIFCLAAAVVSPAAAQPSRAVALSQGSCDGGSIVDVEFTGGIASCYRGSRRSSATVLSNVAYTGALSGTGATVRTALTSTGAFASFASGIPRIVDQGLLIEDQRSSAINYTQAIATGGWGVFRTTLSNAGATAPDGSATAGTMLSDGTSQFHTMFQTASATAATWAIDAYVKSAGERYGFLEINGGSNTIDVAFDTTGCAVGSIVAAGSVSATAASAVSAPNGFCHVFLSGTLGTSTAASIRAGLTNSLSGPASYAPTLGSGLYIWGFQAAPASASRSYLPAAGAVVTRAADEMTISFTGSAKQATVYYGASSAVVISNPTSPFNLGASSGGAWVGSYVRKVTIQ